MAKKVAPQIYMDIYNGFTYWIDGQEMVDNEWRLYIRPNNLVKDNLDTPREPHDIYSSKKHAMENAIKEIDYIISHPNENWNFK